MTKAVAWVSSPAPGSATLFTVLLSTAGLIHDGWPGRDSMRTTLIFRAALPSGETVWVVAHEDIPPGPWPAQMEEMRKSVRDRQASENGDLLSHFSRAAMFGIADDGTGIFIDASLART